MIQRAHGKDINVPNIVNTTDLRGDIPLGQLADLQLVGPPVELPGCYGVAVEVESPQGTKEVHHYTGQRRNTVTPDQAAVLIRQVVEANPGHVMLLDALNALRATELSNRKTQPDGVMVSNIMDRLARERDDHPVTTSQVNTATRIIAAIMRRESLGDNQAHLDEAIAQLSPQYKDQLVQLFSQVLMPGAVQKQYTAARRLMEAFVGNFSYGGTTGDLDAGAGGEGENPPVDWEDAGVDAIPET